jgi:membrane protein YdbS with pleckstrin-like domain
MNVVAKQAFGMVAAFLALFMVVGGGIVLVLDTLAATSYPIAAAAVVLGLVVVSVGLTAALASKSRRWIANPYW